MVYSSSSNRNVIAIGRLGIGKSTLLNCLVDKDRCQPFICAESSRGVTTTFAAKPSIIDKVTVIDTPGLCDSKIHQQLWTDMCNQQMTDKQVCLLILILPGSRHSTDEVTPLVVEDMAFSSLKVENVVLVVNRAHKRYTKSRAREYYETLRENVKDCTLPLIFEDNICVLPEV